MIDWNSINKKSSSDWIDLAQRLINRGQSEMSIESPDASTLRKTQKDLGEFVHEAKSPCPLFTAKAVADASSKVTFFLTAMSISNLKTREDRYEIARAKLESISNKLKADAAMIGLDQIRKGLDSANGVATEIKTLVGQVQNLSKADISTDLDVIAKQAAKVVKEIQKGVNAFNA